MIARRWLVVIAIVCGAIAGGTFFMATQRGDVVVVARDIDVPRALVADDLEVRSLSADLIPDDAARRIEDVVGLVPRAPLQRGQLIFGRAVSDELADFRGIAIPPGLHAIAVPVAAVNAVGGAVLPGARVDVLAIPVLGRAPAGRSAELLASAATVLDVRGESGGAFVQGAKTTTAAPDRIASVVIAVDPSDELRFADRVATSMFVLTLVGSR